MKIRTVVALGAGYALGAKLGPERLEELGRRVLRELEPQLGGEGSEPSRLVDADWPDPRFEG